MKQIIIVVGVLAIILTYALHIIPYFEGYNFNIYWSSLLVMMAWFVSIAIFVLLFLAEIVYFLQKKSSCNHFLALLAIFFVIILSWFLPIPNFVDGMSNRIASTFTRETLLTFSKEAFVLKINYRNKKNLEGIAKLKETYPKIWSLSTIPPRIYTDSKNTGVFYGSALVKHWGIEINKFNKCPKDYLPASMCRKVYENVWVYRDIW